MPISTPRSRLMDKKDRGSWNQLSFRLVPLARELPLGANLRQYRRPRAKVRNSVITISEGSLVGPPFPGQVTTSDFQLYAINTRGFFPAKTLVQPHASRVSKRQLAPQLFASFLCCGVRPKGSPCPKQRGTKYCRLGRTDAQLRQHAPGSQNSAHRSIGTATLQADRRRLRQLRFP